MVSFVFEDGHERGVKVENDKRGVLGFIVQLGHSLGQQEVVEGDSRVLGSIAFLERR